MFTLAPPYTYKQSLRASMILALDLYFKSTTPEEGIAVLSKLYDTLNGLDISSIPRPTIAERNLMRRGVVARMIHDPCPVYTPKVSIYVLLARSDLFCACADMAHLLPLCNPGLGPPYLCHAG